MLTEASAMKTRTCSQRLCCCSFLPVLALQQQLNQTETQCSVTEEELKGHQTLTWNTHENTQNKTKNKTKLRKKIDRITDIRHNLSKKSCHLPSTLENWFFVYVYDVNVHAGLQRNLDDKMKELQSKSDSVTTLGGWWSSVTSNWLKKATIMANNENVLTFSPPSFHFEPASSGAQQTSRGLYFWSNHKRYIHLSCL